MGSQTHMLSKVFHLIAQLTQHFIMIFASNIQNVLFFWCCLHIIITYDNVRDIDRLLNNYYLFWRGRESLTYFFASFFSVAKVVESSTNTLFFIVTSYHITSLSICNRFFWRIFLRSEQFLFYRMSFGATSKQVDIIVLFVFSDKDIRLILFYFGRRRH